MYKVKEYKNDFGDDCVSIVNLEKQITVPNDHANTDYQD